jgi:zinc transport system permease protein
MTDLFFFEPFVINALLAGVMLGIVAAGIGSLVLYQRLSFFGDAISHNALLGIALGLLFGTGSDFTIFAVALGAALLFFFLYEKKVAKSDTLLVIIAQAGLALGMIMVASAGAGSGRLVGFLFGDILSVTRGDIYVVAGCSAVLIILLKIIWNKMLLFSFDRETAEAEEGRRKMLLLNLLFILALAAFIAVAVKIVGVLLVTALLIIPAATARFFSRTPEAMVVLAAVIGSLSVIGGVFVSWQFDFATAPSIVITSATFGFFGYLLKNR